MLLKAVGSVMVLLLNSIEQGIAVVIFLIGIIVLIPFQVFLMFKRLMFKFDQTLLPFGFNWKGSF